MSSPEISVIIPFSKYLGVAGYAKNAVLHFVEKYLKDGYRVELDILNNNRVAKAFWHNLFDMIELDSNHVDTQYEITKVKGKH